MVILMVIIRMEIGILKSGAKLLIFLDVKYTAKAPIYMFGVYENG
jgi:hypothetical protein